MDRFPNVRQSEGERWSDSWPDAESILADLHLRSGEAVASVGYAVGYFAFTTAEVVAPAQVTIVDVNGTLLDEIEAAALERDVENVTTISGDASSLASLLPHPVDVVLIADASQETEISTSFAEQASRSLRPGGRLVLVDRYDDSGEGTGDAGEENNGIGEPPIARRMPSGEIRSTVEAAGFVAIDEVDARPNHYGLVFKREHDA